LGGKRYWPKVLRKASVLPITFLGGGSGRVGGDLCGVGGGGYSVVGSVRGVSGNVGGCGGVTGSAGGGMGGNGGGAPRSSRSRHAPRHALLRQHSEVGCL